MCGIPWGVFQVCLKTNPALSSIIADTDTTVYRPSPRSMLVKLSQQSSDLMSLPTSACAGELVSFFPLASFEL